MAIKWKTERQIYIEKRMPEILIELTSSDWKTIKYQEGALSEEEFEAHKIERQSLREEYNALELELGAL